MIMKRLLLSLIAIMAVTMASAIDLNKAGEYEVKQVVTATGTAAQLYDRAIIALASLTQGNAKNHIDYQDRTAATVVYKGTYDLGSRTLITTRMERYALCTIKVRCKDGRAQITTTVTHYQAFVPGYGMQTFTLSDFVDTVNKTKGKKQQRGQKILADIEDQTAGLMAFMAQSLQSTQADDDF